MRLRRSLLLGLAGVICAACSMGPDLPEGLKEKLEEALEFDTHAIQVRPNEPAVYTQRAKRYYDLREYDKALADCSTAIEKDPNFAYAYMIRGDVFMRQEKYRRALADYDMHLELEPDSKYCYSRRAVCRYKLGEMEPAIEDYDKVIESYSKDGAREESSTKSARLGRCCVNYWAGNLEAAMEDCRQVCAAGGVYGIKFSCEWEQEMERELETGTKGKNICMMPTCPSFVPRKLRMLFVYKHRIWFHPYP